MKYHGYHTRLLRDVWPPAMRVRSHEAKRLAGLPGDDHDLAVLAHPLRAESPTAPATPASARPSAPDRRPPG